MGAIPSAREIHTRLYIGRTDGSTWSNLTDNLTRVEVELGDVSGLGTGGTGADIGVRRMAFTLKDDGAALSPHVRNSPWNLLAGQYSPLLWPMREVILNVAVKAPGRLPNPEDWIRLFHGYLGDRIACDGNAVACEARDLARRLQNCWIEQVRQYGTPTGTRADTVMQKIIDDNLGTGVVQLYVPQTPSFLVRPYQVEYQSVWDAIQAIAAQMGWFLGYKWDAGTSEFRLTLLEPPRNKTAADWTFTADDDIYTQNLDITDTDIRNVVQVTYRNRASQTRQTVSVEDSDSIAEYGRRAMGIEEEDASLIDTASEATAMANLALADLKDMVGTTSCDMPLFPAVDLFSTFKLVNPQVSSEEDFFAVESVRHTLDFEGGKLRTTVIASKKVVGAHTRWLDMQTRPGASDPPGPPTSQIRPEKVSGLSAVGTGLEDVSQVTLAYIDLKWDPVSNVACDSYRVEYRKAGTAYWESCITPLGTATAPQRISGLPGNVQYEFQVSGISRVGVTGDPSNALPVTMPRDTQAPAAPTVTVRGIQGGAAVITSSPGEADWAYDEVYADAKASVADNWNRVFIGQAPTFLVDTAVKRSGAASQYIRCPKGEYSAGVSQTATAAAGQTWVAEGYARGSVGQGAATVKLDFLSASGDVIAGSPAVYSFTPQSSSFGQFSAGNATAPTGTAKVRVTFGVASSLSAQAEVWFDDVVLKRTGYSNSLVNPGFDTVRGRQAGWALAATGRQTYFELTENVEAGQTVYVKARRVDASGNPSAESSVVSATAGLVETWHMYESAVSSVQSYIANVQTGTWTDSATLVDVPDVNVTFDLDDASIVTILFTAMGVIGNTQPLTANNSRSFGRWELVLDAEWKSYQNMMSHGAKLMAFSGGPTIYPSQGAVSMAWTSKLYAGRHTAKVQFRTQSSDTGTNWVGTYSPTLIVQVLKR